MSGGSSSHGSTPPPSLQPPSLQSSSRKESSPALALATSNNDKNKETSKIGKEKNKVIEFNDFYISVILLLEMFC